MTTVAIDRNEVDPVLLGWILVWASVLTLAVAGIVNGTPNDGPPADTALALGLTLGGLSAAWTAAGTWIAVIHLPVWGNTVDPHESTRQRIGPRAEILALLLVNIVIVAIMMRNELDQLVEVLLSVMLGVMGTVIIWQWTQQRIHRGTLPIRSRRSIRQMLGLTFTIALVIAVLKFSDRWLGASTVTIVLAVSNAVIWLVMLLTALGRWCQMALLSVPLVAGQWIAIAILAEFESRDVEMQTIRISGMIISFYFSAFLLLVLMRSSGYRWIGGKPLTN